MSQTVDTEAQEASMNQQYRSHRHNLEKLKEECRKATQAFRRMHQQWRLSIELVKHKGTVDHFRSKSSDTALFLQKIYPPLYDAASKRLQAKGITPPSPVLSQWAHFLNDKHFIVNLKLALAADCISNHVAPIPLEGTSCYDLGARPTNFSYPPEIPSTVTITLPPSATIVPLPQPSAPVIPFSFMTAISQIPVMWPTSHTCHYSSMEYFQEPAPVTTENSSEDSPMRDCSPSPAAPAVPLIQLETHEQLSLPWQAWLSQSGPYHPKQRSQSPSSEEESTPKCQCHNDGSYTPITSPSASPISLGALPSPPIAASPNVDSPPMQINLL